MKNSEEMDINRQLFIVGRSINNLGKSTINEIIDKYIKENKESSVLLDLKEEINKALNEIFPEELEEHIYKYSAEIIKLYDSISRIGLTIKAEFQDDVLTNINGFYLDFNQLNIEDITEEDLKEIYSVISQSGTISKDEKLVITTYQNKNLCDSTYEQIRKNFLEKKQKHEEEEQEEQ